MGLNIEIKKDDPQVLLLFWENSLWKEVSKSLFFRPLKSFLAPLDKEAFIKAFAVLEEKIALKQALLLLAKRAYLSSDLEAKLHSKKLSPESIASAIAYCQAKGYLNDAQQIARLIHKEQNKGLGNKAIFFKLKQQKKISASQLQQSLKHSEMTEKEALEKWLNKNRKKIPQNDPIALQKLMAKLIRRGFSSDLVLSYTKRD